MPQAHDTDTDLRSTFDLGQRYLLTTETTSVYMEVDSLEPDHIGWHAVRGNRCGRIQVSCIPALVHAGLLGLERVEA